MDLNKMIASLHDERRRIHEVIQNLERLAEDRGPRRGRPPKWLQEAKSAASRKKVSARRKSS